MSNRNLVGNLLDQVEASWGAMYENWIYPEKSTGSELWGTLSLARGFECSGWCAYPEVGFDGGHIDLVAINVAKPRRAIAAEVKTFFQSDGGRTSRLPKVFRDAKRLLRFQGTVETAKERQLLSVETRIILVVNWSADRAKDWTRSWQSRSAPKGYMPLPPRVINSGKKEHLSALAAIAE